MNSMDLTQENIAIAAGRVAKAIRRRDKLTMYDVMKRTDLSQSFISTIENGSRGMSLAKFILLMEEGLDVRAEDALANIMKTFREDES